jgi:hypothetical protein
VSSGPGSTLWLPPLALPPAPGSCDPPEPLEAPPLGAWPPLPPEALSPPLEDEPPLLVPPVAWFGSPPDPLEEVPPLGGAPPLPAVAPPELPPPESAPGRPELSEPQARRSARHELKSTAGAAQVGREKALAIAAQSSTPPGLFLGAGKCPPKSLESARRAQLGER